MEAREGMGKPYNCESATLRKVSVVVDVGGICLIHVSRCKAKAFPFIASKSISSFEKDRCMYNLYTFTAPIVALFST